MDGGRSGISNTIAQVMNQRHIRLNKETLPINKMEKIFLLDKVKLRLTMVKNVVLQLVEVAIVVVLAALQLTGTRSLAVNVDTNVIDIQDKLIRYANKCK